MTYTVTQEHDGCLLRSFLKGYVGLSSHLLTHLKQVDGGITVNGEHATVRRVLHEGDTVFLLLEEDKIEHSAVPSDLSVEIVYEDGNIIAFNKPPYMPTHQSRNHECDTLGNHFAYLMGTRGINLMFRPVGRLDRNTSGIVVSAKTRFASAQLTDSMKERRIEKKYIAILEGRLDCNSALPSLCSFDEDSGIYTVESYICRVGDSIITRRVCEHNEDGAQFAGTRFRVLSVSEHMTLVEAMPETGRTHQLRVHFAYIGHPILGDDLYGNLSPYIGRHALHAYSLSLPLPQDEKKERGRDTPLTLTAKAPDDMASVIETFFPKEESKWI